MSNPTLVLRHSQRSCCIMLHITKEGYSSLGFRHSRGSRARLPEYCDVSAGNELAAGQEECAALNPAWPLVIAKKKKIAYTSP